MTASCSIRRSYGRGPKGEVWDLFQNLPEMLTLCRDILKPGGFLILTAYAIRASFLSMHRLCEEVLGPGVRIGRACAEGARRRAARHLALLALECSAHERASCPRSPANVQRRSRASPIRS